MRIPRSKMPYVVAPLKKLLDELDAYIDELTSLDTLNGKINYPVDNREMKKELHLAKEKRELIAQILDKATLCMTGDGTALDIEVYYGN